MNDSLPNILVTGIAGNLGTSLLQVIPAHRVIGVDLSPVGNPEVVMHALDLSQEQSCIDMVKVLKENRVGAVVHTAVMWHAAENDARAQERMWQTNVAGTARVMEAVTEVNRHGGAVRKFIHVSSAQIYGPETATLVDETVAPGTHGLPVVAQKAEADHVVRFRAGSMGNCSTFLLRPHNFAGAGARGPLMNALRGEVHGMGWMAARMRKREARCPLLLPSGDAYSQRQTQFVHVDDVARLIAWLLRNGPEQTEKAMAINVAGSGHPVSLASCAEIAQTRLRRFPTEWLCRKIWESLWKRGISGVAAEEVPYVCGSYTVNTRLLKQMLGPEYGDVIRYSSEAALRASFREDALASVAGGD